jgi:two-component system chemotaxis sensor kinase CheA
MATDALTATFLTETGELLAQMEDGLLRLEGAPDDAEVLNSIFRAGHTVKGGAGLLNQTRIVAFTHVLENVLDRLRKHELPVDPMLISVLLEGKDVIAQMLACLAQEREVEDCPQHAVVATALGRYADLTALGASDPGRRTRAPAAAPGQAGTFRVELKLRPEIFEQGQDPYMFLLELADLAEVLRVEAHLGALPPFAGLDVYKSYLTWTVVLHGAATLERLADVFVFLEEKGQVELRPILDCAHWH